MAKQKTESRSSSSRRRLGRGLQSLLSSPVQVDAPPEAPGAPEIQESPDVQASPAAAAEPPAQAPPAEDVEGGSELGSIRMLRLETVRPNPKQPRKEFDATALQELAASIKAAGLMQPIIVRPAEAGRFEIVAGERRWRAAGLIDLPAIPAIVRDIDDRTAAELSLIENLQREDLNVMERAEAFERLTNEFGLTHQMIAEHAGLNRASVTNHLRLNELDEKSKQDLREGRLSMGHGRALLAVTNTVNREIFRRLAVMEGWSVRQLERRIQLKRDTEELAALGGSSGVKGPAGAGGRPQSPRALHMADLERRLGEHLGTKINIQSGRKAGTGTLMISFYSFEEFEGLLRRLGFDTERT
jgi:ParB family chromosome partitioning protein